MRAHGTWWSPIEQRRAFWIRRTQNGEIENMPDDDRRALYDRGDARRDQARVRDQPCPLTMEVLALVLKALTAWHAV